MRREVTLLAALLTMAGTALGCGHPDDIRVSVVNNTGYTLRLYEDGRPYLDSGNPLLPRSTTKVADRERYWQRPIRFQAHDEEGVLRFDKVITLEDLRENGFRIEVVENVPSGQR